MPQQTPTSVELCCPLHRQPLRPVEGGLQCPLDNTVFPVADDIPVLLTDPAERARVLGTDWSEAKTQGASPLDFYNQTRDHDQYCRTDLKTVREDVERWLPSVQSDGAVLEIGSGKGAVQGVGEDYVALDYSFTALQRYINPRFQRVCATAEHLPFPDASFRFIFSIAALEHVPNADLAFDEIHRILKPGGVAYLHPAWHCTQYNCDGVPVRPYRDLSVPQKWVKLTLALRQRGLVKAVGALPGRILRRAGWGMTGGATRLRFTRLRPDYQTFWISDSDAASRIDSHEGCLYFQSRGYDVLTPGAGALRQLLCRHEPLVVRKFR
jgi:hypothetical protein